MDGARLFIQLFGGLTVRCGDRKLDHFEMRRAASVLALLSYWPGRSQAREELVEMLWQDEEPEVTRQRFRQVLTKLRRGLESLDTEAASVLLADRSYLRLDESQFTTDVRAFELEIKSAAASVSAADRVHHLESAVSHYSGELLPGFYDDWISAERQRLAEAFTQVLCRLAAGLNECGQFEKAVDAARKAIAQDPLREESHYELVRIFLSRGSESEAARQYREMERLLWKELRALPSVSLQSLVQSAGASAPISPTHSASGPLELQSESEQREVAATQSYSRPPPDSTLPHALSRFFGRTGEIQSLVTLLDPRESESKDDIPRIVTITGAGGSGKTRLALEVARRLEHCYDRVVFVTLENLQNSVDIAEALADALAPGRMQSEIPIDQVIGALAGCTALIVLDNFEHLISGGALVVRQLLQRTRGLHCLVTSRQRLNIEGEHERMILPLAVPEEGADLERLGSTPSVELFLDRARQARAGFHLGAQNAQTISALCRKLEGIPLAIELTAAWAFTLSPDQMLERLTDRFNLLVNRRQDSHSRHRSLRATIEWSYQQLAPNLQSCFRKMSAFRGGWTLEAAEAVSGAAHETLEQLDLLRERSLILAADTGAEIRFSMLETLREFANEQLTDDKRVSITRARREYFLALAERAENELLGEKQLVWLPILRLEHENIRAVVYECINREETDAGLRLVSALFRYWEITPHIYEAATWLDLLRESGGQTSDTVRAKGFEAAGNLACTAKQDLRSKALLEQALALYQTLGDTYGAARVECALGIIARELDDLNHSRQLLQHSLPILREYRDTFTLARALGGLALTELHAGNIEQSKSLLEDSAAFYRVCGNKRGLAWCCLQQGRQFANSGEFDAALTYMQESQSLFRLIGDNRWLTWITFYIGTVYERLNQGPEAQSCYEDARRIATGIGLSDFLEMLDGHMGAGDDRVAAAG